MLNQACYTKYQLIPVLSGIQIWQKVSLNNRFCW